MTHDFFRCALSCLPTPTARLYDEDEDDSRLSCMWYERDSWAGFSSLFSAGVRTGTQTHTYTHTEQQKKTRKQMYSDSQVQSERVVLACADSLDCRRFTAIHTKRHIRSQAHRQTYIHTSDLLEVRERMKSRHSEEQQRHESGGKKKNTSKESRQTKIASSNREADESLSSFCKETAHS